MQKSLHSSASPPKEFLNHTTLEAQVCEDPANSKIRLRGLCRIARTKDHPAPPAETVMSGFSPELIQTMRAALDEVMTRIPLDAATPGIKAHVAEVILKAAANGHTNYDDLVALALNQIPTVMSFLT